MKFHEHVRWDRPLAPVGTRSPSAAAREAGAIGFLIGAGRQRPYLRLVTWTRRIAAVSLHAPPARLHDPETCPPAMSSAEEDYNDNEDGNSPTGDEARNKKRKVQRACDVCRRKKSALMTLLF